MTGTEPTASEKETGALRKLWLVLALLGVVVSLNVLDATQGGAVKLSVKAAFGVDFAKGIPEAVAGLWGIVYLTVFVGFAGVVLGAHAARSPGGWTERYAFRTFDLPTGRGIGRAGQVLAVIVLTLTPGWFLGHSWKTMLKHGVLCSEVAEADWRRSGEGARGFFLGSNAGIVPATRMTSSEKAPDGVCAKDAMTSYGAPWQTWLMAAFSLLAFAALARSLWRVARGGGTAAD